MVPRLVVLVLVALGATAALGPPAGLRVVVGTGVVVLVLLLERGLRAAALGAQDEYGPLDLDDEGFTRLLRGIRARGRNRAALLRSLRSVRRYVDGATAATSDAVAERRIDAAARALEEAIREHRPSRWQRRALRRRFARDRARYEASKYAQRVRWHLDRAARLRSERGREGARRAARAVVRAGLADPAADHDELLELARAHDLVPAQAAAPAAAPEAPAAEESARAVAVELTIGLAGAGADAAWPHARRLAAALAPNVARRAADELEVLWRLRFGQRTPAALDRDPAIANEELTLLTAACCDELDSFARRRARDGDALPGLPTLALLPDALLATDARLAAVRDALAAALASGRLDEGAVRALWGADARLSKRDGERFADLAQRLGVGLDPDPRLGEPAWREGAALAAFRVDPAAPTARTEGFEAARLALDLAVAVAAADGTVTADEHARLEEHLASALGLEPAERARLATRLERTVADPPELRGVGPRLAALPAERRDTLARFLLRVAGADGRASPAEVTVLERLWPRLGREPGDLHSELHALAAGGAPAPAAGADPLALDPDVVATKVAETRAVAELLADVFADDGEPEPTPVEGLDGAHAALARALGARSEWSWADVEALADEHELFADGALEVLNERAFELCDEPLWEGDDPVEVDARVLAVVLGAPAH